MKLVNLGIPNSCRHFSSLSFSREEATLPNHLDLSIVECMLGSQVGGVYFSTQVPPPPPGQGEKNDETTQRRNDTTTQAQDKTKSTKQRLF